LADTHAGWECGIGAGRGICRAWHDPRVGLISDLIARVGRWIGRHRPIRLARGMISGFIETDGMLYAAAIAYFALLSLFQLAVLGILLLSFILGEARARLLVINQLVDYTPMSSEDAIEITRAVLDAHVGIGFLAIPLLIFGGIGLFFALQRGVSRAFHTTRRANLLREQLVNLGLMALVGALLVVSLVIGLVAGVVQAAIEFIDVPGGWWLAQLVGLVVPFSLSFAALLLIYRFIPAGRVTVKVVWIAALLGAAAFTVLQLLLTLYATRVADYADVFGPIGTAVVLVLFMFISSMIVLLGASLAHAKMVDERRNG
jgi:membrane protein